MNMIEWITVFICLTQMFVVKSESDDGNVSRASADDNWTQYKLKYNKSYNTTHDKER